MAREASARILLPEIEDRRIQEASTELTSLGFEILCHQDFEDQMEIYLDYINALPFYYPLKKHILQEQIVQRFL